MKIINLLNKIANGEEVPKQIKFDNKIYTLSNLVTDYMNEDGDYLIDKFDDFDILIDEVEIIEEDNKIEKFKDYIPIGLTSVGADFRKKDVFEALLKIGDKINEIIDKINGDE